MKEAVVAKQLSAKDVVKARKMYAALFSKALPQAGKLDPQRTEVATFNLSANLTEFQEVGLGLETVVIFRDEDGSGHTGKVLINLPGQLLLEHAHVDTFVLKKGAKVPAGFVELNKLINNFKGMYKYNSDATVMTKNGKPVFRYKDGEFVIVQADNGERPFPANRKADLVEVFPGKSETFKAIYGDGVLLTDTAKVLYTPKGVNTSKPPAYFKKMIAKVRKEQAITTKGLIYMTKGVNVVLPKCTKHAFLAGKDGAVYLEFSTPSMDEADRFTDPRVIR